MSDREQRPGAVPRRRRAGLSYLMLVLLLAALVAQVLPPLFTKSGVCDEHGAHIPSGYVYLRSGVFSGGINNPPLMQIIVAAPLALGQIDYSPFSDDGLWAARLPVLGLTVLLGLAVYSWAGSLYGRAAAIAALFLFCFEPNVIAHAGLATLDVGVTAFLFLAFFFLWRASRKGRALWWTAACVAMTLALLCKFTALLVLPLFAVMLLLSQCKSGPPARKLARGALTLVFLLACMVILAHLLYHLPIGGESGMPGDGEPEETSAFGDAPDGATYVDRAARFLLPDLYVEGSLGKLRHSEGGHFAYLAGQRSMGGWWYYFPAALAVKTPIPFLALFAVSLVLGAAVRGRLAGAPFLLIPMIFYVAAMAWTGVNIGVRHVLLFYPFAAVAGSSILSRGLPKNWAARAAMAVCAAWLVWGALRIHPHYLAYFNEIAGGPGGGLQYLIDSNIDWGQDENLLRRFISQQPDTVLVNPGAFSPSVGIVAVNVNSLKGIFRGDDNAYQWLKGFEPSKRLGHTWYVYDLQVEDYERAAADSPVEPDTMVWLATALKKSGRLEEALALAGNVAEESPDRAANIWFTAGWWLLEAERFAEAENAFRNAVERGAGDFALDALVAARTEQKREDGAASSAEFTELGEFYARSDRLDRARRVLEEGIVSWPEDARMRVSLALLLGRGGDFAAAGKHAAAALEIDPALSKARRASDWAGSMTEMERMTSNHGARLELGRYEYGFGRPAGAAVHFWSAFLLDPSSQAALAAMGEIIVQAKLGVLELESPWVPDHER